MKARFIILIVVLVVLVAAGLVLSAWMTSPKLIETYPLPGAVNVSAASPIRVVFSRPMQSESVLSHLKVDPEIPGSFSWDKNTLTFVPVHSWPGGHEIKLVLESGAKAASWLSFPMAGQNWSFTTEQAFLTYLWPANGPANLYALNPVTGEIQQFTRGMSVLEYTVSAEGTRIYFSAGNSKGGADLYLFDRIEAATMLDKYKPQELLDCGVSQCRSAAISDDGKTLAYEYLNAYPEGGSGLAQIWMLKMPDLEASAVGQEGHETVQPAWSSSGWLAYYDRSSSLYEAVNPLTQARVQFPNQTGQPGSWSADGNFYLAPEISYQQTAGNHETGLSHLLLYSLHNSEPEDLSKAEDVEDVEGTYSPSGGLIAFARKYLDEARWTLGRQIWLMNSDGSNPHPITDAADYNHYDLAWSRDGTKLAFVRFNQAQLSDPPELWMMNADGSDPLELVVGGYSPIWIP